MEKYRKILVAVDGSKSSKNAFRQACRIAREDGKRLTAVTTVPSLVDQFESLSVSEKAAKALRAEGEKALSEIKSIADEEGVVVKTMLEEGSTHEVIMGLVEEEGYKLVVMGRVGKTRLQKAMMGSVTARVIGHVDADVLVVQKNIALSWEKALLPTDGSRFSAAATDKAIGIAKSYGGELAALGVVDVTEEFQTNAPEAVERMVRKSRADLEKVKKKCDALGVPVETAVKEGEVYKAIIETANEKNSSVIIMGSHGRTGLARLLMGSVTEKVIGHTLCPVLVVKK